MFQNLKVSITILNLLFIGLNILFSIPTTASGQLNITVYPMEYYRFSGGPLTGGISVDYQKSGLEVMGGGFHMDPAAGVTTFDFCFKGKIVGDSIIFTRATTGNLESYIDTLDRFPYGSSIVTKLPESEVKNNSRLTNCKEVNDMLDSFENFVNENREFADKLSKAQNYVKLAQIGSKSTEKAVQEYKKLKIKTVEKTVDNIRNARTDPEGAAAIEEYLELRKKLVMPPEVEKNGFAKGIIQSIENNPKATMGTVLDDEAKREFKKTFDALPSLQKPIIIRAVMGRAARKLVELNRIAEHFSAAAKLLKHIDISLTISEWIFSDDRLKTYFNSLLNPAALAAGFRVGRMASPACLFLAIGAPACSAIMMIAGVVLVTSLTDLGVDQGVDLLDEQFIEPSGIYTNTIYREIRGLPDKE